MNNFFIKLWQAIVNIDRPITGFKYPYCVTMTQEHTRISNEIYDWLENNIGTDNFRIAGTMLVYNDVTYRFKDETHAVAFKLAF